MTDTIDLPNGLGLDRKQMPQISQGQMRNFAKFLSSKGIKYKTGTTPVSSILPTQKHLNTDRVKEKLPEFDRNRKMWYIVSNDMRLIDGTHRWASVKMKDPNAKVPLFKVDLPIDKLIPVAHQFGGSTTKSIHETRIRRYVREQIGKILEWGREEGPKRGASVEQLKAAIKKYGLTDVKIDPNDIDAGSPKGYIFNATECHTLVASIWDDETPAQIRYMFIKDLQQGLSKCNDEKCDYCHE